MSGADDATGQRAVPYVCPFCGEEDLRPASTPGPEDGTAGKACWHCRSCLRLFSVVFHGLAAPQTSALSSARDWSDES